MANRFSFIRRLLSGPFPKVLAVFAVVYGLFLGLVYAIGLLVPDSPEDPVFRVTGVPRTSQILGGSILFGIVVLLYLIARLSRDKRPLDFSSNKTARAGSVLLLVLLFLNGVSASLAAVLGELDSQFWILLFSGVGFALALQILVVYAALAWARNAMTHLVLMVSLSVLNLFALYLSLLGSFQGQPTIIQMGVIVFAVFGFWALFSAVGKRVLPPRTVNAVLALMAVAPLAAFLSPYPAMPGIANRLAPFGGIEFHSKPNIHIVSVDALSPASLVRKHMGITNLPYARVLGADSVVVFENAFASHVPTRPSLNSLMRLAHTDFAGDFGYFAGRTEGPVAHILRNNGYNISTGYSGTLFGTKGPFVDNYLPELSQAMANSTLCSLASKHPLKFFGVCDLASLIAGPSAQEIWPVRVLDIVRDASIKSNGKPAFTLHYIVNPIGHTGSDYRSADPDALKNYASTYASRAADVADAMEQLQNIVRNDEVPSILIVMGDHGAFLSRTVSFNNDPKFVVQDRHGILAAVLVNETGCTSNDLRHFTAEYATPERIFAGLIRCLARDPARVEAAMSFDEAFEFEKFLYE
jgi:hypothetical protein